MKPQELIGKMLPLISSGDKIKLIKDIAELDSDVDVTPTEKPDTFKLAFYGAHYNYSLKSIVDNAPAFKRHIQSKIEKAKKIHAEEQDVLAAISEEKEFSYEEFVDEMLPKVTTEEEVADVFDHDWAKFEAYYGSSKRSTLEQELRGMLSEIYNDPFMPLWEDLDNPTE